MGMSDCKHRRGWLPVFLLAALIQFAFVSYRLPSWTSAGAGNQLGNQLLDTPQAWSEMVHRNFSNTVFNDQNSASVDEKE